jgi:hypothetical protein
MYMDGKQRWLGWIGIGLGVLALAIALFGGSFGSPLGIAGEPGVNMQQSAGQQNAGPQAIPGQQSAGRQHAGPQAGPGANAQPGVGQQNAGPQAGPGQQNAVPQAGRGGDMRRGGGQPGAGGFGIGGWLRFPFRMIGMSFQWAMLALLIGLGVWMLRKRNPTAAAGAARAEPAQSAPAAPLSPTGEACIEEPEENE